MSTSVLPSFIGISWPVERTEEWKSQTQDAASGKSTRIGYWTFPRHTWTLSYEFLRSDPLIGELQQLLGFFNSRQGMADSFLYQDVDDNAVTGQGLGVGDGATTAFQLVRAFGGFAEPIYAPLNVTAVYLDGVLQGSGYSVSSWGSATPGVVTFVTPPGNGVVVTADFTFYFPCYFTADSMTFSAFMQGFYSASKISFRSIK